MPAIALLRHVRVSPNLRYLADGARFSPTPFRNGIMEEYLGHRAESFPTEVPTVHQTHTYPVVSLPLALHDFNGVGAHVPNVLELLERPHWNAANVTAMAEVAGSSARLADVLRQYSPQPSAQEWAGVRLALNEAWPKTEEASLEAR